VAAACRGAAVDRPTLANPQGKLIDDYRLSLHGQTLPAQTGLACAGMRGQLARTLTSRPPVNMPSVA
jgi:hypothetical protein